MLKIYLGDDREMVEQAIERELGGKYEVLDGEALTLADLPTIFQGTTLFSAEARKILIKDASANPAVFEKLCDYLDTPNQVIDWEIRLYKRLAGYKKLKDAKVEMIEIDQQQKKRQMFAEIDYNKSIFLTALRDGEKAVRLVEKVEDTLDPYQLVGLMASQAIKQFEANPNSRQSRHILHLLAKLDLDMKTSKIEPWLLAKATLLRLSVF